MRCLATENCIMRFRCHFHRLFWSSRNLFWGRTLTTVQSIRNALLGTTFLGTRSFYLRNAAGTRSIFQRQERGRNAFLISKEQGRSSLLVPFLNKFWPWKFRSIILQGGDMKFLFSRIHLEMKYVLYYLKIRRVKEKSNILKCLNL